MSRLTILDEIRIASPCEANWAEMAGDERTRFCSDCSRHVYNIASMTADEATRLIVETEGRVCLRIFKRSDGTVLTADCPVGLSRVSGGRRLRRVLAMGLVLPALAVAGVMGKGVASRPVEPFPSGPGATWDDRLDWALVTLGIRTRPQATVGALLPMTMGKMIMGEPSAVPMLPSPPPPVPLSPPNGAPTAPADNPATATPAP